MRPEDLWRNQPGEYFFLSTKSPTGKWMDHAIRAGDWEDIEDIIDEHPNSDIYMCPHGFTRARRVKENSVDPYLLYADLDEAHPEELTLRPTIAIESSPGRYVGYWVTDEPASEELNRRLAYSIGADISGWDRTQVLRVPGTKNYKYRQAPRVLTMWINGPTYKVETLEHILPEVAGGPIEGDEVVELYKKYEPHLPRWARKELINGNPRVGKRSEVLWKLQGALTEAGATRDEAFKLLWASPWNKFKDRRGGEDQLRRELDKHLGTRIGGAPEEDKGWDPLPTSMDKVERRNIEWLVPGLLARKEMTIVEGDPGLGKSYLVQVMAGLICDGKRIPMFEYKPVEGRVAYFDTENTADTVTKARLVENGVANLHNFFQGEEPFSIDDEERWAAVLDRLVELKPTLVVFDTINTYIGRADTHKSSETQQAMGWFKGIAQDLNCAVVVLRHLNKGTGKAIYRGQGSIAFTGAARIVATVGSVPDDDRLRAVTCTKNNLSEPFHPFTYSIEGLADRGGLKNRSKLLWHGRINLSTDAMLNGGEMGEGGRREIDIAKEALEAELARGPVKVNRFIQSIGNRAVSQKAVYAAAELLELTREVVRGEAYWRAPHSH